MRLKQGCEQPQADEHEAAARSLGLGGVAGGANHAAREASPPRTEAGVQGLGEQRGICQKGSEDSVPDQR